MKLITFSRDIRIDDESDICRAGKKYIISEGFLQQIRDTLSFSDISSVEPFFEIAEKRYNGQDLTNKSLLAWRTGGMGDLCFITPNFKYIKENFQNSKLLFGCGPRFKSGLVDNPHIDKLVSLPIDFDLLLNSDYYLMFEGIIESNDDARRVNAYDLFINAFGFKGKISDSNKIPILGLSNTHVEKHKKIISDFISSRVKSGVIQKDSSPKMIGIGLRASHIVRSIIPNHLNEITKLLIEAGCMVVYLGGPGDKDIGDLLPMGKHPMVYHANRNSTDYRDTIAVVSMLDGVIGPDSSCIHIAAAFRKPVVGVYGPFLSKLRIMYYENASGFDVNIACGPCFLHGIETCEYSEPMSKEPLCMHTHQPKLLVHEMLQLIRGNEKDQTK